MKNNIYIILIALVFLSCARESNYPDSKINYPDSKIWKHGVYSKYDAQKFEDIFDGLEVDVIYSPEKDNIYVGRVLADTSNSDTVSIAFRL